jgi:voltage-gated potassium channel
MDSRLNEPHERPGPFQLVLVIFSIYVLVALAVQATGTLSQETKRLLDIVDSGICVLFLLDFFSRFFRSNNKLKFLKWGWIDFVSSLPALPMLRWGRLFRVARVVRLLRGVRSAKVLLAFAFESRAKGTLAVVLLASVLLLTFTSIAVLHVETDSDSNIRNAGDALWWSLATITTVGYGDRYPTTAEGRFLGFLLMTGGVGLFGVFTGYLASWFTERPSQPEISTLRVEVAALAEEVRRLRTQLVSEANTARTGNLT